MNNRYQIPLGFKPFSIGTIPGDWEVLALGEVFEFINTTSLVGIKN